MIVAVLGILTIAAALVFGFGAIWNMHVDGGNIDSWSERVGATGFGLAIAGALALIVVTIVQRAV